MNIKKKIIYFFKKTFINNCYVDKIRHEAIDFFKKKGIPNETDEEWKYINIMSLLEQSLPIFKKKKIIQDIRPYLLDVFDSYKLVFLDGIYNTKFSSIPYDVGKYIFILSNAFKNYKNIIYNYYAKLTLNNEQSLNALNTAFATEGAYIYIHSGISVEKPIHILYLYSSSHEMTNFFFPRNLIVLGQHADVKIIERHQALYDFIPIRISVTEIYAKANSNLVYCKIQNDNASLIDNTFISQDSHSTVEVNTFSFGGKFIRNNINCFQQSKNASSFLNGLTITNNNNVIDNHTCIHHMSPNGTSKEFYKGIFQDRSKGIFNGKIIVYRDAKNTSAVQRNNNILMSNEALINSLPQLEIFSENVKCSHGCTIGHLNKEEIFYLRTRGLREKEAIYQLIFSFANEILHTRSSFPLLKKSISKILVAIFGIYSDFNVI